MNMTVEEVIECLENMKLALVQGKFDAKSFVALDTAIQILYSFPVEEDE